jgi:predicted nucleic acid-binding protein
MNVARMMRSTVYIETTIVSYLIARPGRDLIVAAHQQVTQEWWEDRRTSFELFVSPLVLTEAAAGDPEMAERRLAVLSDIPILELTEGALVLAADLLDKGTLPRNAAEDALHIAIAAVHGIDYLLTWNCRHMANAQMRQAVISRCTLRGCEAPIICTPEELMGS